MLRVFLPDVPDGKASLIHLLASVIGASGRDSIHWSLRLATRHEQKLEDHLPFLDDDELRYDAEVELVELSEAIAACVTPVWDNAMDRLHR